MLWKNNSKIYSAGILIATLASIATGCGKAGTTAAPVAAVAAATTGCPAGQINLANQGCRAGDFATVCNSLYGQLGTVSGVQVCRTELPVINNIYTSFSISFSSPNLPIVDPASSANGINGYNTNFVLKKGDALKFSNGSGGYGAPTGDDNTFLWGFGHVYTSNSNTCNAIGLDGKNKSDSTAVTNGSASAGLFASDGTAAYSLGTAATVTIANAGTLKLGFNAPAFQNLCGKIAGTLTVIRCEDAAGNSYTCQ